MVYKPTLAVIGQYSNLAYRIDSEFLQLPPHTRTLVPLAWLRLSARQPLENRASQAVAAARGIVLASAREMSMLVGSLNEIRSSARQYWLYAPRPFTSPRY